METLLHMLRDAVAQNQFLQGGFVLALFGVVGAYCRRIPAVGWGYIRRQFITRVEISNNDALFDCITLWLAGHPYSKRARDLVATTADSQGGLVSGDSPTQSIVDAKSAVERPLPRTILTPAPGTHFLRYKKTFLWLERQRTEPKDNKNGGGWFRQESYVLRIFGKNREAALSLLDEARARTLADRPEAIYIYAATYDYWPQVSARKPRPLSSVFLPDGLSDRLLDDVRAFMRTRDWYVNRGIPYRRGYLFHGLPGSGKTSFIVALAGELKVDLYVLNLPGPHTDSSLPQLLARVPPHSILLIEDIDATFSGRNKVTEESGLTFAGFLNALDGAISQEGMLVFMTTNRKDVLDPALIRPGRADVHVLFDYATAEQAARMFRSWFPEVEPAWAAMFGGGVESRRMSMAEVQAHLLLHKDSAREATVLPALSAMPAIEVVPEPVRATA